MNRVTMHPMNRNSKAGISTTSTQFPGNTSLSTVRPVIVMGYKGEEIIQAQRKTSMRSFQPDSTPVTQGRARPPLNESLEMDAARPGRPSLLPCFPKESFWVSSLSTLSSPSSKLKEEEEEKNSCQDGRRHAVCRQPKRTHHP